MKHFQIILLLLLLPILLTGQNRLMKIDSIFNLNYIDTTHRKVYQVVEIMPKLENDEDMLVFISRNSSWFSLPNCVAFQVYISFVVEADSTITNRKVYVESVYSKYKGFLHHGNELLELQTKIERGFETLTRMIPGKQNNKEVATRVFLPIHFDKND